MALIDTQCCIAGGGPAGMMLGLLLARVGIDVVVLEKHRDFLRDFRGDTIHPSTMQIMHELGVLERFLARPHQKVDRLGVQFGAEFLQVADFSKLPTRCKFIAMMPQWDFLDFLADEARAFPGFHLHMEAEVTGLRPQNGRIVGVEARTPQGRLDIQAGLTIGADGRHSIVREKAGLTARELGAPIDVLWMRLSRHGEDIDRSMGWVGAGEMMVLINRQEYWQCAFVIPKGGFDAIRARGLADFQRHIATLAPFLANRVEELRDWADIKLLTVAVNRLERWHRPGLLCIGDAAHAMSPVGGVGINLAIQDAVAAGNILAGKLRGGGVGDADLAAVERRRLLPTRIIQRLQLIVQDRVISNVLASRRVPKVPPLIRWLLKLPVIGQLPARLVGLGFRPEHVNKIS